MTLSLLKPTSLVIRAENDKLVGLSPDGNEWTIYWVGNGQYSHWAMQPRTLANPAGSLNSDESGWYEFIYTGPEYEREKRQSLLEKQIRAAEHRHKIYR